MKRVDRLVLLAVAALSAAAFGCGDSSSPGVAACSEPPASIGEGESRSLECKEGTGVKSVQLGFSLEKGTTAVFSTEIGGIVCSEAHGKAKLEQREAVLEGKVTELELRRCKERISACSSLNKLVIGVPIEPVEVRYLGASAPQGKLVLRGPGTFVSLACALVGEVTCIYGKTDTLPGTIGNPPNQKLRFDTSLEIWRGSESCPERARVRMTTDVEAEGLVLDDGSRSARGSVWVAQSK